MKLFDEWTKQLKEIDRKFQDTSDALDRILRQMREMRLMYDNDYRDFVGRGRVVDSKQPGLYPDRHDISEDRERTNS